MPRRIAAVLATASLGLLVSAAPALGHVTANPGKAEAGGYSYHAFRVGHACEGSPTTKVSVSIPDGVVSVKPQEVAGWTIAITRGPITPYEQHREKVSEGVKEVSWTGGPLPDDHMQQFGISMKLPDKAGQTIHFPTVQTCKQGVNRWIDIPVAGQSEPETPAPGIELLAKAEEEKAAAVTPAKTEQPASEETQAGRVSSEDDNQTLAVVALVIGALGLLTGGASLAMVRRRH
jgi:uncharacterized protein YcnI